MKINLLSLFNNLTLIYKSPSKLGNHAKTYSFIWFFGAQTTKSGDPDNHEAQAAVYYWANLFPPAIQFRRKPEGEAPNNLLNYGYAILRAITARALVCSGLLPTLGIHHHNKYNAYCLADDIMEPYRPFVDRIVCDIMNQNIDYQILTKEIKAALLNIATMDVMLNEQRHPLMVTVSLTTASLVKCFEGKQRKIIYPTFSIENKNDGQRNQI